MTRIDQERQRLYPVCPEGQTRTLALHFARASDWPAVAALFQALQTELELPAPAVSVAGTHSFGVWLSLAEAVPTANAESFLLGLQQRYLSAVPARHLDLQACAAPPQIPALIEENGKWSAFIDPTLGDMFIDEPWLEIAPNPEKQADILAGLRSIKGEDLLRVLSSWQAPVGSGEHAARHADTPVHASMQYSDPRRFLLAVMNDPSVSLALRIEAAKALLPDAR